MKTLIRFFKCVSFKIKKNFFVSQKHDISHDCEEVPGRFTDVDSEKEKYEVEEYLKNYTATTRWQTV
jgi:hypothetical protein